MKGEKEIILETFMHEFNRKFNAQMYVVVATQSDVLSEDGTRDIKFESHTAMQPEFLPKVKELVDMEITQYAKLASQKLKVIN